MFRKILEDFERRAEAAVDDRSAKERNRTDTARRLAVAVAVVFMAGALVGFVIGLAVDGGL